MDRKLTARQSQILDKIREAIGIDGFAPSISELADHFGFASRRSVSFHLEALERKGYLYRTGAARGINLVGGFSSDFFSVPLLGVANAGEPLALAEEDYIGEIQVDKKLIKSKRKVFGLELKGDSMNQQIINGVTMDNGNYVIVARDEPVANGDIVLAVIDNAATIKKYQKDKRNIVLYPNSSNQQHRPIYLDRSRDTFIAGKVLTVLANPMHAVPIAMNS